VTLVVRKFLDDANLLCLVRHLYTTMEL